MSPHIFVFLALGLAVILGVIVARKVVDRRRRLARDETEIFLKRITSALGRNARSAAGDD